MASSISSADNMLDLMIDLVSNTLLKTPASDKHPIFDKELPDIIAVQELYDSATGIQFAPNLYETLMSPEPPTTKFFLSTPPASDFSAHDCFKYAVYNGVMQKAGYPDEQYIGLAAATKRGHKSRMKDYTDLDMEHLPSRVKLRLSQGWKLVHIGFLAWWDRPAYELSARLRLLGLAIETTLTFSFWTINWSKTQLFGYKSDLCLWDRKSLSYKGLCTHSAMREAIHRQFGLTESDLQEIQAELERRDKQHKTNSYLRKRDAARAHDYDGYKAENAAKQRAQRQIVGNREKMNATGRKSSQKRRAIAIENELYTCKPCEKVYSKKVDLDIHLAGPQHAANLDRLAQGLPLKPMTEWRLKNAKATNNKSKAKARANAMKNNTYWCTPCGKALSSKNGLKGHNRGKGHLIKAAELAAKLAEQAANPGLHHTATAQSATAALESLSTAEHDCGSDSNSDSDFDLEISETPFPASPRKSSASSDDTFAASAGKYFAGDPFQDTVTFMAPPRKSSASNDDLVAASDEKDFAADYPFDDSLEKYLAAGDHFLAQSTKSFKPLSNDKLPEYSEYTAFKPPDTSKNGDSFVAPARKYTLADIVPDPLSTNRGSFLPSTTKSFKQTMTTSKKSFKQTMITTSKKSVSVVESKSSAGASNVKTAAKKTNKSMTNTKVTDFFTKAKTFEKEV
jgi:hypothetical protein